MTVLEPTDRPVATPPGLAPPEPAVRIAGVSKRFGAGAAGVIALDQISLDVERGEFVCIVGASGCGKSTLLNLIAGLDAPTVGSVEVQGRVALMFQEAALLPWKTAAGNVELALKLRGVPRRERREQALDLLHLVRLREFADRRPHELSGGMRQRVALARSLGQGADVLLMDEPFGALDALTRVNLQSQLLAMWAQEKRTVIFITHDVDEAVFLANRVIVMAARPGRLHRIIPVDLAYPRTDDSRLSAAFTAIRNEVWTSVYHQDNQAH